MYFMITIITIIPLRRHRRRCNKSNGNYAWADYLLRLFLLGGPKQRTGDRESLSRLTNDFMLDRATFWTFKKFVIPASN